MFGLNDSNNNSQDNQGYQPHPDSPTGQGPSAPVHGPFSNISPGGSNNPAPAIPGTPVPPSQPAQINDINPPQPTPSQGGVAEDELLDIKHQALESLAPLVSHLDQTPEERFKTTMMLIQASDNPQLLHEAYEAAHQIEDEKIKAQALLDVVNEINYFTNHQSG